MDSDNVATVKEAYARFLRGDIAAVLELIDEHCEWDLPGTADMPWAGHFHGPQEVERFFAALSDSVEYLEFEPRQFLADGDTVLVLGREKDKVKASGKIVDLDWVHQMEVRNGKITRFCNHHDTAKVYAAMY